MSDNNNKKNVAAPTGANVTTPANKTSVVSVTGGKLPEVGSEGLVKSGAGDLVPPVGTGGKDGQQSGGVTREGSTQGNTATETAGEIQPNTQGAPETVDIDSMIEGGEKGIQTVDQKKAARIKKAELLTKAINSKHNFETVQYVDDETKEFIGSRIRYLPDADNKTVYDYADDPEVSAHLEFKIDEKDPRNGEPVDQQVSIAWINTEF